ncbi:amidase signature enzyme [Apiospora marii]|uniref:amidase signature enzyme n=1 Tax=Apiospora marii TaxID=335849 RepID=UPI00312F87EE
MNSTDSTKSTEEMTLLLDDFRAALCRAESLYCPISDDWIISEIQHFEKYDDVFRPEFLQGLVIVSNSQEDLFIERDDFDILGSTVKTDWIYITQRDSHLNQLKAGPHHLYHDRLRAASRLYDDTQYCFLTTFQPQATADEDLKQLRVAATRYQTLGVAVPSRLARSDNGNKTGLSQMRIAVKDLFHLRGLKTSLCNKDYYRLCPPAQSTATVIQRLADAGGQILGLTKLSSMIAREEPLEAVDFQTPFNPRGDGYQSPAGSSSGSAAAVASYDWLDCAIGTDTSGSGRRPALVNGVYQFRPTHSNVSLDGMVPTFPQFDTPCVFARDLQVMESVLRAWLPRQTPSVVNFEKPFDVFYPVEHFPLQDAQQNLIQSFLDDMSLHFDARIRKISIQDLWHISPPEGVTGSLADYLRDVITQTYYYSYYHSTDSFRDEFAQKYARSPYVIPFVRERWEAGASVSDAEHAEALHKPEVYKSWLLQLLFKFKRTLMVLPIAKVEPNYRDEVTRSPASLPDTDQLYLPPILGSPDIVVPIGEVGYHSRATETYEYLPAAINVVAAPGEDFWLLKIVRETLRRSGRRQDICTGSRVFQTDRMMSA